jgi:hypothetical protein
VPPCLVFDKENAAWDPYPLRRALGRSLEHSPNGRRPPARASSAVERLQSQRSPPVGGSMLRLTAALLASRWHLARVTSSRFAYRVLTRIEHGSFSMR